VHLSPRAIRILPTQPIGSDGGGAVAINLERRVSPARDVARRTDQAARELGDRSSGLAIGGYRHCLGSWIG
jgi:hypothetical protein